VLRRNPTERRGQTLRAKYFLVIAAAAFLFVLVLSACGVAENPASPTNWHIFVILEENRPYENIIGSAAAPNLTRLAKQYGVATNFFAETHPSQPNYIAILGGSTLGITDDDAFYCEPGSNKIGCPNAKRAGYPRHTVDARSLMDQLGAHGLTWKGYFESIPSPASKVVFSPATETMPAQLYAAKHNGFMSFASVQNSPHLAERIVNFDTLKADLASGNVPNYAQIVPNQ
jgi:phospholipase C